MFCYVFFPIIRYSHSLVLCRIILLKSFKTVHRKTSPMESIFIKVTGLGLYLYWKRTLLQLFSSHICKIFSQSISGECYWVMLFSTFTDPTNRAMEYNKTINWFWSGRNLSVWNWLYFKWNIFAFCLVNIFPVLTSNQ